MEILEVVVDFLFGCHHVHLSRVFTLKGETYKVCCDCGAKFAYSLETMSIEHRLPLTPVLTRFRIAWDRKARWGWERHGQTDTTIAFRSQIQSCWWKYL